MHLRLKMRHRTPPQKRISQSLTRFNVAAWGRQSGKTTFGLDKMLIKPLQGRPGGKYWYILQTYDTAQIAYKRFEALAKRNPEVLGGKPNKGDLMIPLIGGREISFKSGRNYEDLRAETLDGCIIDEVRQQDPLLWTRVIRPMLTKRGGWCDFYSTPNGFDHFKDLWDFALEHPNEWSTFQAPSSEAWWWTEEELQSNRLTMSEDEYAQEILADFREIGKGKVFKPHGVHNQLRQNPFAVTGQKWSPYLPIIVGLDFNVGKMVWELLQYKAGHFHYVTELAIENTNTEEMAPLLVDKVKGHRPGVVLVGDASGKSQKTSAAGKTDYSIIMKHLHDAGIPCRNLTPESNPMVKDRVNMTNSRLKSVAGTVNLTYDPIECKHLKKDFERLVWKEGADGAIVDKSNHELTHASDAATYPICYYAKDWKPSTGTLKVIER